MGSWLFVLDHSLVLIVYRGSFWQCKHMSEVCVCWLTFSRLRCCWYAYIDLSICEETKTIRLIRLHRDLLCVYVCVCSRMLLLLLPSSFASVSKWRISSDTWTKEIYLTGWHQWAPWPFLSSRDGRFPEGKRGRHCVRSSTSVLWWILIDMSDRTFLSLSMKSCKHGATFTSITWNQWFGLPARDTN